MKRVYEPEAKDGVALDGKVERLSRRIAELEQVIATAVGHGTQREESPSTRDAMWKCCKCSSLLAFYDQAEDILRIRYKEHLTYVKVGQGGWVQVVCKSCGEPNIQSYASEDQVKSSLKAGPTIP